LAGLAARRIARLPEGQSIAEKSGLAALAVEAVLESMLKNSVENFRPEFWRKFH
jgi:hypothetical protein